MLPHWERRIGEDGCLQLRGAALFDCYLRLVDGTVREERPVDADGWFGTRDLARCGPEGLTVLGRADRHVAGLEGRGCLGEGEPHPVRVLGQLHHPLAPSPWRKPRN